MFMSLLPSQAITSLSPRQYVSDSSHLDGGLKGQSKAREPLSRDVLQCLFQPARQQDRPSLHYVGILPSPFHEHIRQFSEAIWQLWELWSRVIDAKCTATSGPSTSAQAAQGTEASATGR